MRFLKKLIQPAAVSHAKDYDRVNLIFGDAAILFDVDAENGYSSSSFHYYLGLTGDKFNLYGIGSYLQRYAAQFGYDLGGIAEEYATYIEEVCAEEGSMPPERERMVSAWFRCDPEDKAFSKNPYHSGFLDFSAYFLFDRLGLTYRHLQ